MASEARTHRTVAVAAAVLCLASLGLLLFALRESRQTSRQQDLVSQEAAETANLIRQYRRLKLSARKAVEPSAESLSPAAFFERLADKFAIDRNRQVKAIDTRIVPRNKQSPYEEQATVVRLDGVTQKQLGDFLPAIERENPQYLVKELRLTASEAGPALWNASITVSLLVYKPGT